MNTKYTREGTVLPILREVLRSIEHKPAEVIQIRRLGARVEDAVAEYGRDMLWSENNQFEAWTNRVLLYLADFQQTQLRLMQSPHTNVSADEVAQWREPVLVLYAVGGAIEWLEKLYGHLDEVEYPAHELDREVENAFDAIMKQVDYSGGYPSTTYEVN